MAIIGKILNIGPNDQADNWPFTVFNHLLQISACLWHTLYPNISNISLTSAHAAKRAMWLSSWGSKINWINRLQSLCYAPSQHGCRIFHFCNVMHFVMKAFLHLRCTRYLKKTKTCIYKLFAVIFNTSFFLLEVTLQLVMLQSLHVDDSLVPSDVTCYKRFPTTD